MPALPENAPSHESLPEEWSGPRPLAGSRPAIAAGALVLIALVVLSLLIRREVALPAQVASHYVDLMAGSLTPDVRDTHPEVLARALHHADLDFTPRIRSLEPDFGIVGGRVHRLRERLAATWFYRDHRSDMLLAEAFTGTLEDLGRPEEIRDEAPPRLHVFRKTTQTLVFWQEGAQVYALTATLPGERTIALARRLAATPADNATSSADTAKEDTVP